MRTLLVKQFLMSAILLNLFLFFGAFCFASESGAVEIDDSNFASEITSYSGAAMVDFNATWCGPCRKLSPIIEEIANETVGQFKVGKLDVDKAKATTSNFEVSAIPCIIFFINGKEVGRMIGLHSKEEIQLWVKSMIPNTAPAPSVSDKVSEKVMEYEEKTFIDEKGQTFIMRCKKNDPQSICYNGKQEKKESVVKDNAIVPGSKYYEDGTLIIHRSDKPPVGIIYMYAEDFGITIEPVRN